MSPIVLYGAAFVVFMHGLIHLMGTVSYWQLAEISELPYKTTLLNGQWDLGAAGIQVFGGVWLVATVVMVIAAYGLAAQQSWWQPVLLGAAVLSLVITGLDWDVARIGAILNVVIIAAAFLFASNVSDLISG